MLAASPGLPMVCPCPLMKLWPLQVPSESVSGSGAPVLSRGTPCFSAMAPVPTLAWLYSWPEMGVPTDLCAPHV